jgi:hypothetical protein
MHREVSELMKEWRRGATSDQDVRSFLSNLVADVFNEEAGTRLSLLSRHGSDLHDILRAESGGIENDDSEDSANQLTFGFKREHG